MSGIMPLMTREEILHLASLARIRLTDEEVEDFITELPSILEYVSTVSDIAGEDVDIKPAVGKLYNVFRKDEVTNEPDSFTKDILNEMPHTEGRLMKVKKILKIED